MDLLFFSVLVLTVTGFLGSLVAGGIELCLPSRDRIVKHMTSIHIGGMLVISAIFCFVDNLSVACSVPYLVGLAAGLVSSAIATMSLNRSSKLRNYVNTSICRCLGV